MPSNSESGVLLSKKRLQKKSGPVDRPDPPTIISASEAGDRLVDDAREIGIIFDPKRPTSPQDIKGAADEMVKLGMMNRVVHLSRPAAVSPFEPTKECVDTFLEVRKQMREKAGNDDERASATSYAVATTVKLFLDEAELNLEPALRLARLINYHFVMSMYISASRVCDKQGIDGRDFLLPEVRRKREARMAKEKGKS